VISRLGVLRWLVLAAYVFVMFKEGFVRHDQHSLMAWSGLAVAALVYPLSLRENFRVPSFVCWVVAGAAVTAVAIDYSGSLSMFESMPAYVRWQSVLVSRFLSDRQGQLAQWQRAKTQAWVGVRAAQELPRVSGSVDTIPSIQSSLLAYGLDYR